MKNQVKTGVGYQRQTINANPELQDKLAAAQQHLGGRLHTLADGPLTATGAAESGPVLEGRSIALEVKCLETYVTALEQTIEDLSVRLSPALSDGPSNSTPEPAGEPSSPNCELARALDILGQRVMSQVHRLRAIKSAVQL